MKQVVIVFVLLFFLTTDGQGQTLTAREQTILNVFGQVIPDIDSFENINCWTDGFYSCRPFFFDIWSFGAKRQAVGDTIFFSGGSLHEGGYRIPALLDATGKMKIAEDDYRFKKGDAVSYRVLGGDTLLIISDVRTNSAKEVLKKFDSKLYQLMTRSFLRYILSGRYIHAGSYLRADNNRYIPVGDNSRNIVFSLDKQIVSGFKGSAETSYDFVDMYEIPEPILRFSDKEAYQVTKILIGLELAPMKPNPDYEGGWELDEDKPVIQLNKATEMIPGLPVGRFPLASMEVMSLYELELYAGTPLLPNLQLMRNEIFARYGYKFRSGGDMDNYFSTQDWYRPQFDDVTSKLTEIERINIDLIQVLEKR
jgi:hypothetical protein